MDVFPTLCGFPWTKWDPEVYNRFTDSEATKNYCEEMKETSSLPGYSCTDVIQRRSLGLLRCLRKVSTLFKANG